MTDERRSYDPEMKVVQNLTDELKNQKQLIEIHIERFKAHEEEEIKRHDSFLISQTIQKQSIDELTESTQGMVDAWEAANGAIKVANNIGKIMKWVSSFAVVVGVYTWFKSVGS